MPLFALANAGVDLRGGLMGEALRSPITWGVVIGLVVGKLTGIGLGSLLAVRLRLGRLPQGVGEGQVVGGAALSGIGFTVALLITGLAFESQASRDAATLGVLVAAVVAFCLGWLVFWASARFRGERTASLPMVLAEPVDAGRDHIRGRPDAALTLVEYGDFECPFCGRATGVVRELRQRFGDDLRYVFRHLPLPDVHPRAERAAEAAEAAGAQGRSGRCTTCSSSTRASSRTRTCSGTPRRWAWTWRSSRAPSTPRRWPDGCARMSPAPRRAGRAARPRSSSRRTVTWRPTTPRRWPAPWRGHGPAGRRVSGGAARPPGQWRRAGPALPRRPRCRAGRRCPSRSLRPPNSWAKASPAMARQTRPRMTGAR